MLVWLCSGRNVLFFVLICREGPKQPPEAKPAPNLLFAKKKQNDCFKENATNLVLQSIPTSTALCSLSAAAQDGHPLPVNHRRYELYL